MARVFVRGIEGEYALKKERERMKKTPRVIKGKDVPWLRGPQHWCKHYVNPETSPCQSIMIHMDTYAPGSRSQKHGHMNEALFYVLEGKGYEIHDGKRYEWEAGDVAIVHNGCVHQHFNADKDNPAKVLVIKPKPLYNFLNLLQQGLVEAKPKEDTGFRPEGTLKMHDTSMGG